MNQEEQRITIAEVCGWYPYTNANCETCWCNRITNVDSDKVPDYLNDLNAMHDAEKILTKEQWLRYTEEVRSGVVDRRCFGWLDNFNCVFTVYQGMLHISAAQKAEAFLKTLNLWKE